uniref:Putative glucose-6-phosphate 1-epimerase n=1 Tax=uncultured Alphaproteobacteria bacterium TaxID=91750 RepID=A0A6G8F229_9PROT|nr:D-hexose-6-phosphate mutarotase [uncultured Alphaproteobacteria bacterium]
MSVKDSGFIILNNRRAECKISLWGANIVSYRPKTQEHDVFWLGDLNKFDNVQAIRGGIPVCWPRFAEEKLNDHLPRHGFARLSDWCLHNVQVDEDKMEAKLSLLPDAKFNVNVTADLFVKITDKLECTLETVNNGNDDFRFSEALHAYFNVGSRDETEIKGLTGHQYRNALDGKIYTLENDLIIRKEFDAAFMNHTQNVEIVDTVFNRIISVEKSGSNTTVVWNPDKDLAEMSLGQYKNFVCVEPANQGALFVTLPPKEKHRLSMAVSVRDLK